MERWVGKVAVVTGASAGIGAATAQELVKNGLIVVGLARRVERVEALKKGLENAKGKLHALKCDISKESDIISVFKWVKENLGAIHVLVNNAGIARSGGLLSGEPTAWREVLNVNVMGLCICTQQAFKLMKESGVDDGHIIHISSVAGHYVPSVGTEPSMNVYAGSKHAVRALTETVRQELRFLKTNTRITSISPGLVETEIFEATMKASNKPADPQLSSMLSVLPSLKSKDVADAVVYALSTPSHVQVHEIIIRPVGEPF